MPQRKKVGFTNKRLDNSGVAGLEDKFIDDNTFVGVERYDLKSLDMDIPDNFDFKISISNFRCEPFRQDEEAQFIEGRWNFNINVNVNKSITNKISVNSYNESGFGISDVVVTPFEINVITKLGEEAYNSEYFTYIKDENGMEIERASERYEDGYSIATFSKGDLNGDKITIELYRDILAPADEEGARKHLGSEFIYSVEVNLK